MYRITVTLKSGKRIQWDTADIEPIKSYMMASNGFLSVENGRSVHFEKSEVAAAEFVPLAKCAHCGRYVVPKQSIDESMYGNKIYRTTYLECPACGASM